MVFISYSPDYAFIIKASRKTATFFSRCCPHAVVNTGDGQYALWTGRAIRIPLALITFHAHWNGRTPKRLATAAEHVPGLPINNVKLEH